MSFFDFGFGDIFDAVLGGLSGVSQGKQAKKAAKTAGEFSLRQVREGGVQSRRNAQYEAQLSKWLRDKEKEDRRKGLSNYARFSSVDYGTPNYIPDPVGDMPTQADFDMSENSRPLYQNIRGGR